MMLEDENPDAFKPRGRGWGGKLRGRHGEAALKAC